MSKQQQYTYRVVEIHRPTQPPPAFIEEFGNNPHPDALPVELLWSWIYSKNPKKYHSYSGASKRVANARRFGIIQRIERAPIGEWETR
jgi:hypothetical protein